MNPMTIKELIKALENVDEDMTVWTTCISYSGKVADSPVLKVEDVEDGLRRRVYLRIEDW